MVQRVATVAVVVSSVAAFSPFRLLAHPQEPPKKIAPLANMTRLSTIDERYQSYNIEMLEVTGGMFWKPYGQASSDQTAAAPDRSGVPAGMDANLYEYRPPVDLSNEKLRRLPAALGPPDGPGGGDSGDTVFFW